MKTYKLLLLLIGLSIMGCSDLEEEPIGLLAPEGFFQSTDDIQSAVNATYAHALNEEFWGRKLSISLMLRSDMVSYVWSGTAGRLEHDQVLGSDDSELIYDPWNRTYRGIAAANTAIAGAALVNAPDEDKNPIIAQAYFMRAFYYFHLVRLFGPVPYLTEPVTATTADAQASIGRTPVADVYAGIISDLEFAKLHLPNNQDARSLPAKSAASSYLSLVYLTMAGTSDKPMFQKAFDEAQEVITLATNGTYDNLGLDSDFQNLFNANKIDASPEPIFALDYNNVEAEDNAYDQLGPMTGIWGNDLHAGSTGWSQTGPALSVYTTWDANDYRRAVSFDDKVDFLGTIVDYTEFSTAASSSGNSSRNKNQPYNAKYYRYPGAFARGNVRATSHNYSMMRYAEVLLIAAESAVEIGDNISATTYLNMVRDRARQGGTTMSASNEITIAPNAIPADISGTVTANDVLEERRFELAFECKRWYDIVRRDLGATVYSASGFEGAKPGYKYLIPLPGTEIISNPNLAPNNP